jgi:hypothetical protein
MPNQIHLENPREGRCALRHAKLSLFAFFFILFFCLAKNAAGQGQTDLWSSTTTPRTVDSGDGKAVELGVKFSSSQLGFITGIRFYKSAANTGTHIGNLWTSSGTLLASAVFRNESASGWQQVSFSSPVAISANTTYVASYYAPQGHFSDDNGFFSSAGVNNPPLQALANSVSPNGVYTYGSKSAFPTSTYKSSNYWVDVVYFSTIANSLWSSTTTPGTVDSGDGKAVELGVKFSSSQLGFITGIRFYKSAANTGTHIGNLWTSSGTLLASAVFRNESASGWQQVSFSSPVAISANTTYVASYYAPQGHFSDDNGFFSSAGVNNPPLQALANSVSPNGVYTYGSKSAFPTSTYKSSNYWVDVVFNDGTGTPTAAVASLSPSSLTFTSQAVGTTSAVQTITLMNTGNSALTLTSLALTGTNPGDFAQTNNCGASVAAAANCTISVTFTPSQAGSRTASVSISDNASGSPQTASLSGTGTQTAATGTAGTGTAALVSLSPTSLAFGNQAVDMTSAAQTVALNNTGNATLSIASLALTGTNASDFDQSNTCGSSLAAGAKCTIVVMFTPSVTGTEAASLSIADNSSASPQTVPLSGAGTHDAILSWTASATPPAVVGYNVYRGTTSGGPYPTQLNSTPVNGTTYCDETVQAGQTYYYVVTAVASDDVTQSADSVPASATVPSP